MKEERMTHSDVTVDEIINALASNTLLHQLQSAFRNLCILILTPDTQLVFANDPCADYFPDETPESLIGKTLSSLLEPACSNTRRVHFAHPVRTGRPAVCLEIMRGVRMCSRFSPLRLQAPFEEVTLIMWTIEAITHEDLLKLRASTPPEDLYEDSCFDLGALNVLSDRELEVLALMGHGLRSKEISEKLCRSISTINRHREHIGEKLGITDRAILIRLANLAVLEVEDASRMRRTITGLGIIDNPPSNAIERATHDLDADTYD